MEDTYFDILDGTEVEEKARARQERIEKARLASQSYSAKIEEPQWYDSVPPSEKSRNPKDASRAQLYSLNSLYFNKQYHSALTSGLTILKGKGKEEKRGPQDEVELLDFVMRCALRVQRGELGSEVDEEVLEMARKYVHYIKGNPGLSYSSSLVLSTFVATNPSSSIVSPLEPLSAVLSALSIHPTPSPYFTQLAESLSPLSSILSTSIESGVLQDGWKGECETIGEGLGDEERSVLEKCLRSVAAGLKEDEGEAGLRDVRSL